MKRTFWKENNGLVFSLFSAQKVNPVARIATRLKRNILQNYFFKSTLQICTLPRYTMIRTPPIKESSELEYNCQICPAADTIYMVQCDVCDLWYHFQCVGVDESIGASTVPWKCQKCSNASTSHLEPLQQAAKGKAVSITSKLSGRQSTKRSTASSIRRRAAALQLLEEEKALAEETAAEELNIATRKAKQAADAAAERADREQQALEAKKQRNLEFIRKKGEILLEESSDSGEDDSVEAKQRVRTNEWVAKSTVPSEQCYRASSNANRPVTQNTNRLIRTSTAANSKSAHLSDCESVSSDIALVQPSVNPSATLRPDIDQPQRSQQPSYLPPLGFPFPHIPPCHPEVEHLQNNSTIRRQHVADPTNQLYGRQNPPPGFMQPSTVPPIQLQPAVATPPGQSSLLQSQGIHQMNQHLYGYQPVSNTNVPSQMPIGRQTQPISSPMNPSIQLTSQQYAARHAFGKDLLTFSGKAEEWPGFISQFENTSNACGFSNVENITRLQRCLKGEALAEVGYQLMLPELLPEVLETLRTRFGRPEMIINSLLQKIRSEPAPKPDKLETLMSFAQSVRNLCCVITASGLNDHLRNPMLIQELVNKLPAQQRLDWSLHRTNLCDADLKTFEIWLSTISRAVSAVTFSLTTTNNFETKPDRRSAKPRGHLHTHAPSSPPEKEVGISIEQQLEKMTCNERWNEVRRRKLCRTCLARHPKFKCPSNKTCDESGCTRRHHRLLHNETTNSSLQKAEASCNTHKPAASSTILFRIVPVKLFNRSEEINTFAFLDDGSSLTMIEESAAAELQLEGAPETLCLKWTADQVREEKDSRRVSLEIAGSSAQS